MANNLSMSMALVIALVASSAMLHGSSAQTTHVVGDTTGWTIPNNGGASMYSTWASRNNFTVGDILVFRFPTGAHDVTEVNKAGFDGCTATNSISKSTNGPANITLRTAGQHYYICSFPSHCGLGQKLAINVSAATAAAPRSSAASPPRATPAPVPSRAPAASPEAATPAPSPSSGASQTYTVGDNLGWNLPSSGSNTYQTWVRNKNFNVGDTLVFNFANGAHNVAEVSKSSFDTCSATSPINTVNTGPARIPLTTSGEHYYICTFPNHCSAGMKLAVNVTGTGTGTGTASSPSATSPSSNANTPPGATAPSADSPPPPPSTASPSIAVAALPVTLLSVALAFLY